MREKGRERRSDGERGKGFSKNTNNHPENIEDTTTFYITNFPDKITAADLLETFARYWRIVEVFIPAKRDKFG
jgi:RNA recognition motif-containing protein